MEVTKKTNNLTKLDLVNATNSIALSKAEEVIHVVKAFTATDVSFETGEIQPVAFLVDSTGKVYSTISGTAIRTIDQLIGLIDDEEREYKVTVDLGVSSKGREFVRLVVA